MENMESIETGVPDKLSELAKCAQHVGSGQTS
jgi:hypothetical protein